MHVPAQRAGNALPRKPASTRSTISPTLAAVAVASIAGCSEKPPRPAPEHERAYNGQDGDSQLRERTLKQAESGRIQY